MGLGREPEDWGKVEREERGLKQNDVEKGEGRKRKATRRISIHTHYLTANE